METVPTNFSPATYLGKTRRCRSAVAEQTEMQKPALGSAQNRRTIHPVRNPAAAEVSAITAIACRSSRRRFPVSTWICLDTLSSSPFIRASIFMIRPVAPVPGSVSCWMASAKSEQADPSSRALSFSVLRVNPAPPEDLLESLPLSRDRTGHVPRNQRQESHGLR